MHKLKERRQKHIEIQTSNGVLEIKDRKDSPKDKQQKRCNWFLNAYDSLQEKANSLGKLNQDVPLNRFIAFSWSYMVFLVLLVWSLLTNKVKCTESGHSFFLIDIKSVTLLLYMISFVLQDIHTLITCKIKVFRSFWRVYDLVWHLLLGLSLSTSTESVPLVLGR